MTLPPLIWESFHAPEVRPGDMDDLWSLGWRHFGAEFFRYSISPQADGSLQIIVPLRLPLASLQLTKSQRRVLRKNEDLQCLAVPATLSAEAHAMFDRHRQRFTENVPESLGSFLSPTPATVPCRCLEFQCRLKGHLVATSFLDIGGQAVSSVYGMFEPEFSSRSLGIFTMLQEMLWARDHGFTFYHPGYATLGSSAYDYKKQFHGLEGYAWEDQQWKPWAHFQETAEE